MHPDHDGQCSAATCTYCLSSILFSKGDPEGIHPGIEGYIGGELADRTVSVGQLPW